ncbi:MAG TPA: DUF2783 domain-containing protein [Candidimonas sp.]|nr:DUF2783 domain-containing protein [Candidimonas sp.]
MNHLSTQSNFAAPDAYYERLINAHQDLSTAQSHAMNAALVLMLSNHIGDIDVINDALAKARAIVEQPD